MEKLIASRLNLPEKSVHNVVALLTEGATIPFIARYRKERTGSLDEVAIADIDSELKALNELAKRKTTILERLKELDISDPKLLDKIKSTYDSKELEDIYLPYKPKRVTRASKAIALGLEPLAKIIMSQKQNDISAQSVRFAKKGMTPEEALSGARDIIAEWVNESAFARNQVRRLFENSGVLSSKVVKKKQAEAQKYKDYFDFSQPVKRMPGHRYMAVTRAEKEGFLKVKISIDSDYALQRLERIFIKTNGSSADQIKLAVADSLKRLLSPSLESEIRAAAKEKADLEAIQIFSKNLSQLLLASPLGPKPIIALDPGFRTGCKVAILDKHQNLVKHSTIFPHPPANKAQESERFILESIQKHHIEGIAIGNGTAGRETERFIKSILPKDTSIEVYLISESGASIYSASEVGRTEFPELDLTVRGAISIGRRLIDPLAELVKLDPKSIGVGQYQHDVDQTKLKDSLTNTVSFAVNKVGVNLNTASEHLLQYVSGIGPKVASNIKKHRDEHGRFANRKELLKVKGLGSKAYEQAAGFLRIKNGDNPLDNTGVHPESYAVVKQMAKTSGLPISKFIGDGELLKAIKPQVFVSETAGLPTLIDILNELKKPGLDIRGAAKAMAFDATVTSISDLRTGMKLPGKVTNLTKFGAFVDLGIKENGLIHKSQMADKYVDDPSEILHLDQEVLVRITEVDVERKRIQLSLRDA
ncbi:MAG: Tex family protein [Flavobacteriales bacterium]